MSERIINQSPLSFLVTIVNDGEGDDFTSFFREQGVYFNITAIAHGTAPSELLDYLGLGVSQKEVVFSTVATSHIPELFALIEEKTELNKPGNGISFSIPVNAISGQEKLTYMMGSKPYEKEENPLPLERDYDVVLTIIDRGFSDNVMDAAKIVGATGGTVFHARGAGIDEAEKFLGISIQPEKELVFILVPHELKKAVMQNIYDQCGLSQPGKGLCFALPVGHVLGLAEKEAIAEMKNDIKAKAEAETE